MKIALKEFFPDENIDEAPSPAVKRRGGPSEYQTNNWNGKSDLPNRLRRVSQTAANLADKIHNGSDANIILIFRREFDAALELLNQGMKEYDATNR